MTSNFEITGSPLSVSEIDHILREGGSLSLSGKCRKQIQNGRSFLDSIAKSNGRKWYGINTGFGSLYNVSVSPEATERLQLNLIRSHAAGAGPLVPYEVCRIALLLKIVSFCPGNSGVSIGLVEKLIELFNAGLIPAMYQFGSLGASGDLAPLAHLALTVIGEGEFISPKGKVTPAALALSDNNIQPIVLKSKEGLALINGTQFSSAYGVWAVQKSWQLYHLANICGALSFDAFNGNPEPFDERIHLLRPHPGQIETAAHLRRILQGSMIASQGEKQLQDPYAFRCMPQVHGASKDVIDYCNKMLETEVNSVTDNPLVFAETEDVLSGGNFHGQPVALAMDFLAMALAELGSISERRTYQLVSGHRGLPDYLTLEAGIQSGFMIAQYTAASIVNRNKMLCTPSSIDSIPSSKGQEDHVSMSANAASKLYELCDNVHTILSIEFLTAMRALSFRRPARSSPLLEQLNESYKQVVQFQEEDMALHPIIEKTKTFTQSIGTE